MGILDEFVSLAGVAFIDAQVKHWLIKMAFSTPFPTRKKTAPRATAATAISIDDHLVAI
jgi:hypothetical protein